MNLRTDHRDDQKSRGKNQLSCGRFCRENNTSIRVELKRQGAMIKSLEFSSRSQGVIKDKTHIVS